MSLFKKSSFWIAVGGVAAVVANHFFGFDQTQVVDIIGALVAAVFGTTAGISTGKEDND